LAKRIYSKEIKDLFAEWKVAYPKTTTCTANNDVVKTKMEKDGLLLYFSRGWEQQIFKTSACKTKG
jgi:hypothetical protein